MEMFYTDYSQIAIRRLFPKDKLAIKTLYAFQGNDASWLTDEVLDKLIDDGKFFGGFLNDWLCICGATCRFDFAYTIAEKAFETSLFPMSSIFILPLALSPLGAEHIQFFIQILITNLIQNPESRPCKGIYSFVPVKTGIQFIKPYFDENFSMIAIRPLYDLRPHYIFSVFEMKKSQKESILVSIDDTFTLSRHLEHGYVGTWHEDDNNKAIILLQ